MLGLLSSRYSLYLQANFETDVALFLGRESMQKFAMSEERMFMIVINEAPCLTISCVNKQGLETLNQNVHS